MPLLRHQYAARLRWGFISKIAGLPGENRVLRPIEREAFRPDAASGTANGDCSGAARRILEKKSSEASADAPLKRLIDHECVPPVAKAQSGHAIMVNAWSWQLVLHDLAT